MVSVVCLVLLPLAVAWMTSLTVDSILTVGFRQRMQRRFGWGSRGLILTTSLYWVSIWWSFILGIPTCLLLSFPAWAVPLVLFGTAQVAQMVLFLTERINRGVNDGVPQ